ncbi:hypothetical protein ACFW04_011667 [Cataglyphis niger]
MFVNKFGIPLKKHGTDERLRPAIESVRNYVRDNALCASSADEYDARERKIRRLVPPKEDADATSKSYVDLALRAAKKDEIEYRENAERIASQLRKDADEAGQGVVLLFARLAQLESALSKWLDTTESAISKIETNVGDLNKRNKNLVKEIARNSVKSDTAEYILDKRLYEKSQIATKFIDKIKNLEESTSRLTKESDELNKRIKSLEKAAIESSNKANSQALIKTPPIKVPSIKVSSIKVPSLEELTP